MDKEKRNIFNTQKYRTMKSIVYRWIRARKLLFLIITLFILSLLGCSKKKEDKSNENFTEITLPGSMEEIDSEKQEENPLEIKELEEVFRVAVVYVCGAVHKPGVYTLPHGSRVYEAIEAAGGVKDGAAEETLNQAEMIKDGERIYIPTEDEIQQGVVVNQMQETAKDNKINLNTASKEELKTLPGIGDAKADSIISYRDANGGFQSVEQLMQIEGIKEGVFEKIKDKITV